jgi:hypothetical protein
MIARRRLQRVRKALRVIGADAADIVGLQMQFYGVEADTL